MRKRLPIEITVKVPPVMNTVSIPWNILVGEATGCAGSLSVVDWLGDCCCGRRRVMNVSSLCRNFIFVWSVVIGGIYRPVIRVVCHL